MAASEPLSPFSDNKIGLRNRNPKSRVDENQLTPCFVFSDGELISRPSLELPSFVLVYNELQARSFVCKRSKVAFDRIDIVLKVETPFIKFLKNSERLRKGAHVAFAHERGS